MYYLPQRVLPPSSGEPIRCFLYRKSRAKSLNFIGFAQYNFIWSNSKSERAPISMDNQRIKNARLYLRCYRMLPKELFLFILVSQRV